MARRTKSLFKDRKFLGLLLLVVAVLLVGMVFYNHFEHWRLLDSLYFSAITLTTVGYGDFAPHTDAGKVFTIIYLLAGIGVLLALVAVIAENTIKRYRELTEAYILRTDKENDSLLEKLLKKEP